MRKLLNTLYVTSQDAFLARDGENALVRIKGETKARFPIHTLEGIVSFGFSGASPALMALCCERGVPITFLTENGRFLARVTGPVTGNVLLRRQQYRIADDDHRRTAIARLFLIGKTVNCRVVLQRFVRDHGPDEAVASAAQRIASLSQGLYCVTDLDALRGLEGEIAREYYAVFDRLVTVPGDDFTMRGRNRRPPLDRINALLSFLYTLLASECANALESVGLDPQVGFLHTDRAGRAGLALDLMEELRPHLADRLALTLVNTRRVEKDGFEAVESGAVVMSGETRKVVLTAWQTRKRDVIRHAFLGEQIECGLIPYAQALLLARHVRGDIDGYPPFSFR